MILEFIGPSKEYLLLAESDLPSYKQLFRHKADHSLTIIWNTGKKACFRIDHIPYSLAHNQLCFLTAFHTIEPEHFEEIRMIRFNNSFYCVLDHDSEVGCKGSLFFGAAKVPLITIPDEEIDLFETVWKMFNIEMQSRDNLQIEMLRMMLKRLLILFTRIYKQQHTTINSSSSRNETIRLFHFLVESYFKEHHDVAFYASKLNRTPKSISNFVSGYGNKSPLTVIQERIMAEARQLLQKTNKPVKEVAYILGYEDIQSFSRFFKSKEKISPVAYRVRAKQVSAELG